MDVGSVRLHGVLEYGLQELDDGGILGARARGKRAEIDVGVPDVLLDGFRKAGDLLGAPVNAIDGLKRLIFADGGDLDIALERALHLVGGKEVRRVGESDEILGTAVFEHDGSEPARLRLREPAHQIVVQVIELQTDVGDVELPRERFRNLLVVAETLVDQHASQAPSRALLLLQGDGELLA